MKKTFKLVVTEYYEFDSEEEAEAFVDFKQASKAETPECVNVQIEKYYDVSKLD